MTDQEAIKNIEQIKRCVVGVCDDSCKYYDVNENCCKYDLETQHNSLDMAIKTLEEQDKWIPVSERLPEIIWTIEMSGEVLVTVKRKDLFSIEISRTNGYYWFGVGLGEVIAWKPLPEPYKGEIDE